MKPQVKRLSQENSPNALPIKKNIFYSKQIPNVSLAGRLKHFVFIMNWQKITSEPTILGYVTGYKIPLSEIPFQNLPPPPVKTTEQVKVMVLKEIEEMLKKETITP